MTINKLPTIAKYWRDYMIWSVMTVFKTQWFETNFGEILQNLHFADKRKVDKKSKAFKMRPVIDKINSKFSKCCYQMIVSKAWMKTWWSGMKQYIKSKPIKWGFKFWFCYSSKFSYLYEMDVYLGRKQTPEFNLCLGEEVLLQLTKDLEWSFWNLCFNNFFQSLWKTIPKRHLWYWNSSSQQKANAKNDRR